MNVRGALLLALALALTGCTGSLLESSADAPEIYRLAGEAFADRGERLPLALAVARPRAAPALDTERIAVVRTDSRFDYFVGVRWSERPADAAADAGARPGSGRQVRGGGRRAEPRAGDLLLDVELRRFEVVYRSDAAAPEVRTELQVSVVDPRQGRRLASFGAAGSAVATENRRAAVVDAFERATAAAVREAVSGVREAVSSTPR